MMLSREIQTCVLARLPRPPRCARRRVARIAYRNPGALDFSKHIANTAVNRYKYRFVVRDDRLWTASPTRAKHLAADWRVNTTLPLRRP